MYAVFASANQAGTAILLVISAVFSPIGIQGTPLTRLSTGSNTVELERRRRVIEQKAMDVAENDPERAEGIIEGAGLAVPALRDFPYVEENLYQRRLVSAISELGYESCTSGGVDPGLIVRDSNRDATIAVAVKYLKQSPLGDRMARNIMHQYDQSRLPLLIVTNVRLTKAALQALTYYTHADRKVPARSVQWRDSTDNDALRDALAELFGLSGPRNPM